LSVYIIVLDYVVFRFDLHTFYSQTKV